MVINLFRAVMAKFSIIKVKLKNKKYNDTKFWKKKKPARQMVENSRSVLYFFYNDFCFLLVQKKARQSGGYRGSCSAEKWQIARSCRTKAIFKSKFLKETHQVRKTFCI